MLFNHENTPVKHLRFNWAGEKVETRKTKYYNFVLSCLNPFFGHAESSSGATITTKGTK